MRIAIASGKGGTGKTTVSTSLARVLSHRHKVQYVDCDVEEPNGHLFLNPKLAASATAGILVPQVDESKCTGCGRCSAVCRFHAIACLGKNIITFPKLCHGCGGCTLACPAGAITEICRPIGVVEEGEAQGIGFVHGRLNVGEAMSPPLIREVAKRIDDSSIVILDAPPGTACPVVASMRYADKVVLVTEPTAFGLHDLTLAVDTVEEMSLPYGVFINRADIGDDRVERYCAKRNIPIWGRLPHDRRVAECYSLGIPAVDGVTEIAAYFESLASVLLGEEAAI